jgi:hypothetical protein
MKRILLLTGFVFIIAQVRAQFDDDFDPDLTGKGARAAGMAYAFNAVADDATALSWNPAGIMQIKKPELAFSNSLKNTEYRHAIYEYDYKPVYTIDFLGFVYPLKLKKKDLVFGVSYQNKMNLKYNYENLPSEIGTSYGKRNLTVNSVSLTGAYSINRFIGVGISYNHWFSFGNKSETYDSFYDLNEHKEEPEQYPDTTIYTITQKYRYSGNNFTMGILLDFSSFHFPLRYTLKCDSRLRLSNDFNYTGRIDYIYNNNIDTTVLNLIHGIEKFEFPVTLTNALAYRFGDYLTIACEFDLQFFKDTALIYDYTQEKSFFTETDPQKTIYSDSVHLEGPLIYDFTAINHYCVGLEYILHPEFGFIPVRTGWKCSPTEMNTYDINGKAIKRVIANSINFGTGITLQHFSIDLAYEAFWYHRKDEEYRDEKQIDHFFVLSAIWYIK